MSPVESLTRKEEAPEKSGQGKREKEKSAKKIEKNGKEKW